MERKRVKMDYLQLAEHIQNLAGIWAHLNVKNEEAKSKGLYLDGILSWLKMEIVTLENLVAEQFHRDRWVSELYWNWVQRGEVKPWPKRLITEVEGSEEKR